MRKTKHCDMCNKEHHDVKSLGVDADGMPDAPDACFLCRKEMERHQVTVHTSPRPW